MHLTLRQLALFEAVAQHLSFTRAAQEFHLSQPAVSMQVRQLEENVGLPLFDKLGKKIQLTEAGEELYYYSQKISRELQEAGEVMEELKGVQRGHLRISVATTANHFATRTLAAFISAHQGTRFSLDVTNRKKLLEQLANSETDLVIMGEPPMDESLESIPFMENPLVAIASAAHVLAGKTEPIPVARIARENFVVREAASGTRAAMERFFKSHNLPLHAGIEMTSNEAIKHAVEAGLGLGIVSVHTLELELETRRLVVLNVEDLPIMRHWYIVQRKGKRLSPVGKAFHEFLLSELAAPLLKSPVAHPVARAAATVAEVL